MSLTITMTPTTGSAITFAALDSTNGRKAYRFDPGAPLQDNKRSRTSGMTGSYLVRCGTIGRVMKVEVVYIADTLNDAVAMYASDAAALTSKAYSIACAGQTYPGCNLEPASMRMTDPPRGIRTGTGAAMFKVIMTFRQDSLS